MGTLSAFTSCKIWIYRPSNSFSALTLNNFISPASSTLVPVIHKIYCKMFWHFVNLWSMKAVIDQMLLILFRVWPCRRVTYVIINDSNKFLSQGIFIIIVKGKTQSLSLSLKGSRQTKKRVFYGQTDRKRWPPLPQITVSFSWFFWLCVWHLIMNMCSATDFTKEKGNFHPTTGWSFAKGRPLRMIIRKRQFPPNDHLQPRKGHDKSIFETLHYEMKCVLSMKESNVNEKMDQISHLLTVKAEGAHPRSPAIFLAASLNWVKILGFCFPWHIPVRNMKELSREIR